MYNTRECQRLHFMAITNGEKQIKRPPVVVVMGHIDHGKSTLLDYIRKSNTAGSEAGGITQHISAYEAECKVGDDVRTITFLDTPGHEAFCSIRERGASVADIAILVVAADDGVKPQTIEALSCIRNDGIPFIVALNKIDKPGANIDKTKQSLAENEVFIEGWGGSVPAVAVSAKTGDNITDLLELIILQSDMEDLKGDPSKNAEGFIIESELNPKQGISATLIIKDGLLKIGMFVAASGAYAKVRSIHNFQGKQIDSATFSSPVEIVGWDKMPGVGQEFRAFADKEEAIKFANTQTTKTETDVDHTDTRITLPLIIKTDTYGSLEAVEHEIKKIGNEKIRPQIVLKGIGAVSENDIKTAEIKHSLVIGFNVSTEKNAEAFALRENIQVKSFRIIYELMDFLRERLDEATPISKVEVITGSAKVLRIFSKNKDKQVIGGKVQEGEIKTGSTVKIIRRDAIIGEGKIKELQVQKIKADHAKEGDEFGLMVESKIEIAPIDVLQATIMVDKK